MSRALILGGTGAIGRATAHRLLGAGWQADLTGRDPAHMPAALAAAGARFAVADRGDPGQLAAILGGGADLLVAGAHGGPDADLVPAPGDEYFARFLDYPAEDRYLANHHR